ncbi:MAG: hypothetical protein DMF69_24170, partial [Acidobacteria bacterium]
MDQQLFEKIIKKWRKRSNPTETLTLNQIANMVLLSGSSKNASIIGTTLSLFIQYFYPPKGSYGHKWGVNWTTVQRDHPHLFDQQPRPGQPPEPPTSRELLDDMKLALTDEIAEVKRELNDHPLNAWVQHELGMAGDGSFLYESYVELPRDTEFPIPEGVGIFLKFPRSVDPYLVEATLLSYDALNSLIIFEVTRPLSSRHVGTQFTIIPRLEELLVALKARLSALESAKAALSWRLLRGDFTPERRSWNGPVSKLGLDNPQ